METESLEKNFKDIFLTFKTFTLSYINSFPALIYNSKLFSDFGESVD